MNCFKLETLDFIFEINFNEKIPQAQLRSKALNISWADGPIYYSLTTQESETEARVTLTDINVRQVSNEMIQITGRLGGGYCSNTLLRWMPGT